MTTNKPRYRCCLIRKVYPWLGVGMEFTKVAEELEDAKVYRISELYGGPDLAFLVFQKKEKRAFTKFTSAANIGIEPTWMEAHTMKDAFQQVLFLAGLLN